MARKNGHLFEKYKYMMSETESCNLKTNAFMSCRRFSRIA